MPDYRLYCLDGQGCIGSAEAIKVTNDDEAVEMALTMKRGGLKCEVWEGQRLVASLDEQQLTG